MFFACNEQSHCLFALCAAHGTLCTRKTPTLASCALVGKVSDRYCPRLPMRGLIANEGKPVVFAGLRRASMASVRLRRFCFTLNNYCCEVLEQLESWSRGAHPSWLRYLVCQEEISSTGTPHLQGYIELTKALYSRALAERYLGRDMWNHVHLLAAKGSAAQNITYCSKDDTRAGAHWVVGSPGRVGDKNQYRLAVDMIVAGERVIEVARSYPYVFARAGRGLLFLKQTLESEVLQLQHREVIVLCGETGLGKTRGVVAAGCRHFVPPLSERAVWFDGYGGEDEVCIDDFDGAGSVGVGLFLRITDTHLSTFVPYKGGFVRWQPTRIWITSNREPRLWFPAASPAQQEAVLRRISICVRFPLAPGLSLEAALARERAADPAPGQ